jgi:hypothetical protein
MAPTRVLVRRITKPLTASEQDELLAVMVDTRSETDPSVAIYSITHDLWRVEPHRKLMQRSRRADPSECEQARWQLEMIGEHVRLLRAAPRAPHESE